MTLQLPKLLSTIPTYTGKARRTPFAVGAADSAVQSVKVRFPQGYTKVEHLPEPFTFANPLDPLDTWIDCRVETAVVDGCLEVRITREAHERVGSWYKPDFIELVRDRSRIANSRAGRTIVVSR